MSNMDLTSCLNSIKEINHNEFQKKVKKYNLKINKEEDNSKSYFLKKYLMEKKNYEYRNVMKLKSLRLENKDKKYNGSEESFFEKLNDKTNNIFKKKWTSLNKNLKIIKLNEYFKNNKIEETQKKTIKYLLEQKKLKKQVEYDEENGIILNIKLKLN